MKRVLTTLFALSLVITLAIPMSVPVTAATLGLVGLWHFDEGSGTTAYDASGYGNNAALHCGADYDTGILGQALSLNAQDFSGAYASIPHDCLGSLDMTDAYTFEAWIKIVPSTDTYSNYLPILFRGTNISTSHDIEVYVDKSTGDLVVAHNRDNGGTFDQVGFPDPPANEFFYLMVTFDGADVKAYYNGVEQSITTGTSEMSTPLDSDLGWWIGRVEHDDFPNSSGGNTNHLCALMDELRIWNIVAYDPTDGFVNGGGWIYSPVGAYAGTSDSDLVALWHFDELCGTTAYDSSSYVNNASLHCGADFSPGMSGNALNLNFQGGVPDFTGAYAYIPYSDSLNITGPYKLDAYLQVEDFTDYPNEYRPILVSGPNSAGASDQEHSIEIYVKGNEALYVGHNRRTSGTFGEISFPCPPIGTGVFFHLEIVFDGTHVRAYYDGVEQSPIGGNNAIPAPSGSTLGWWIGRLIDSELSNATPESPYDQSGFCGLIDELQIWNAEVTKATFNFMVKYDKKTKTPEGNIRFKYNAGDLNFRCNNVDWLVMNQGGSNAQFGGQGNINCVGDYGFIVWARDDAPDTFRIKIWVGDDETAVVYDNGTEQPIGGGNIVVHKGH